MYSDGAEIRVNNSEESCPHEKVGFPQQIPHFLKKMGFPQI